jgi:hypothetical protein
VAAPAFVVGLVLSAALAATLTSGAGRVVVLAALMLAALGGRTLRDWREALAGGLAASAVGAWCASDTGQAAAPVLTALCIVLNAGVAAWYRARTIRPPRPGATTRPPGRMLALPAPRPAIQPSGGRPIADDGGTYSPLLREAEAALAHARPGPAPHARRLTHRAASADPPTRPGERYNQQRHVQKFECG